MTVDEEYEKRNSEYLDALRESLAYEDEMEELEMFGEPEEWELYG